MQKKIREGNESTFWISDGHGKQLAFFIRSNFAVEGLKFFTKDDSTFQIAAMNRPEGEYIEAHIHKPVERTITGTHEVLFLQTGKIRVDVFDEEKTYLTSVLMQPGDVVLLCGGGHGIEVIEEARLIEVKQGPFAHGLDKEKFEHSLNKAKEV